MYSCIHTHSTFCDGKNSLDEMAKAAYEKGIKSLGFSAHSYVAYDGFGMKAEAVPAYVEEIDRLKKLYSGTMDIICGCELDSLSDLDFGDGVFKYYIGSAHFVTDENGISYPVDCSAEKLINGRDKGFCGDMRPMVEGYYKQFTSFIEKAKPNVIGHFDLIGKYNEDKSLFDSDAKWYKDITVDSIDAMLAVGAVFEMNLGKFARGYGKSPYPSTPLIEYIVSQNGKLIITTDAHKAEHLDYFLEEAEDILKGIGCKSVMELTSAGFIEREL